MKYILSSILCFFIFNLSFSQNENKDTKTFMFYVYSDANRVADLESEAQQKHIKKIGAYIESLAKQGKLKDAQPLEMEGVILSNPNGEFETLSFKRHEKVIAGYYLILAKDLDEAIAIAKADPRYEEAGWEIEIRPIKKVTGIN